ncbi:hypothetical protein [Micromonospora sp. NPDC050200]|uniref:hypothetical protein n=1 Tax=Micromonospora sp. NPDC050200 TaxID=3155664 RepID=UPI0033C85C13
MWRGQLVALRPLAWGNGRRRGGRAGGAGPDDVDALLHEKAAYLAFVISFVYWHLHAQRARPITGIFLDGGSAALGWFVNPVVGLIGIIVMII